MRTKYSIINGITSFISNIITFAFLFISQTVFIKVLGIEYTGLNGLFNNVLTLLNLFELGVGSAITYNLYKFIKEKDKETTKSIMLFYKNAYNKIAIIIFIIGLIILPFIKLITKDVTVDINIYIIYFLFLLSTVATYISAYKRNLLFVNQKNYVINIIHIINTIILNIIQIAIIYITKNYYLYLAIKIICVLIENIVISLKVNKEYPYIKEKNVKKLDEKVKSSITNRVKALFIHKASGAITNGTDSILISAFLNITTVGLYTSYNYIISAIKSLFKTLVDSARASVGNLLVENNENKNYQTYKKINFLNFWISTFTSISLLILIEPFIKIWLGKEYLLDKITLIVLIINYFQTMMRSTYNIFKDSAGIWIEDKYVPVIQSTINLISSIILLKLIGLPGVFIGTILSSLVLWFYSYPKFVYTKLFNKTKANYYLEMIKYITIFVSVSVITYLININISNIILNALTCLIIPNLILIIIFKDTDEFKYYLNLIKKLRHKS